MAVPFSRSHPAGTVLRPLDRLQVHSTALPCLIFFFKSLSPRSLATAMSPTLPFTKHVETLAALSSTTTADQEKQLLRERDRDWDQDHHDEDQAGRILHTDKTIRSPQPMAFRRSFLLALLVCCFISFGLASTKFYESRDGYDSNDAQHAVVGAEPPSLSSLLSTSEIRGLLEKFAPAAHLGKRQSSNTTTTSLTTSDTTVLQSSTAATVSVSSSATQTSPTSVAQDTTTSSAAATTPTSTAVQTTVETQTTVQTETAQETNTPTPTPSQTAASSGTSSAVVTTPTSSDAPTSTETTVTSVVVNSQSATSTSLELSSGTSESQSPSQSPTSTSLVVTITTSITTSPSSSSSSSSRAGGTSISTSSATSSSGMLARLSKGLLICRMIYHQIPSYGIVSCEIITCGMGLCEVKKLKVFDSVVPYLIGIPYGEHDSDISRFLN